VYVALVHSRVWWPSVYEDAERCIIACAPFQKKVVVSTQENIEGGGLKMNFQISVGGTFVLFKPLIKIPKKSILNGNPKLSIFQSLCSESGS
jgi:hypothetical protein